MDEQQVSIRRSVPGVEARRRFDFRAFVPQRLNTQITRRYALDPKEVGAGAFGKVFVAADREVEGRKVAIKKFGISSPDMRAAFEREVELMKELDHPNICKILETYDNGRTVWVVMEYCAGREVYDRIAEQGGMEELETARIARQVALALKYAHGRGIAHRDLKPENVCFCEKDRANDYVKVIDWGVGFHFNAAGMNSVVGSTYYAAPEVLQANQKTSYTAACDLWSLGVMTYVMLCGKPPFWGVPEKQLRQMLSEKYPMSDKTWQATSDDAKDFIRGLLKVDIEQRMPINAVLAHPWFSTAMRSSTAASPGFVTEQVLSNCRRFSRCNHIFSIAATNVAKQLDHHSLQEVRQAFVEMDTDCDGMLELREMLSAFEKRYGKDSKEARGVEEVFNSLDLDGSGKIDYTEFCAAALGVDQRMSGDSTDDEVALRAAFKAFDVNVDDGRITRDEVQRVLQSAAPENWEQVTEEFFTKYDFDHNGYIDFAEFKRLVRDRSFRSGSAFSLDQLEGGAAACASTANTQAAASIMVPTATEASANSAGGPTLLESRRRTPSISTWLKEPARGNRLFGKVSDMISKKKSTRAEEGNAEVSV